MLRTHMKRWRKIWKFLLERRHGFFLRETSSLVDDTIVGSNIIQYKIKLYTEIQTKRTAEDAGDIKQA